MFTEREHRVKTRIVRSTTSPKYDEQFTLYGVTSEQITLSTLHFQVSSTLVTRELAIDYRFLGGRVRSIQSRYSSRRMRLQTCRRWTHALSRNEVRQMLERILCYCNWKKSVITESSWRCNRARQIVWQHVANCCYHWRINQLSTTWQSSC